MKAYKLIVVSCVLALVGSPVFAAAKKGDGAAGDKAAGHAVINVDKLKASLDLTDAQLAKIKAIADEAKKNVDAATTPEAKKAATATARTEARAKIAAVLTPEQQQKYSAAVAKGGEAVAKGGKPGKKETGDKKKKDTSNK